MEGVVAVLTADDVPPATAPAEPILTNEPMFIGDRILAVAARSEELAQEAIDRIKVEYERCRTSSIRSRACSRPAPTRAPKATSSRRKGVKTIKWTAGDFATAGEMRCRRAPPGVEWSFGDVDAGFAGGEVRARRIVRDGGAVASLPRAAQLHGVLAGRQGVHLRLDAEPDGRHAEPRAPRRRRARQPRLHLRVLRRRFRLEDQSVSRRWACRSTWRRRPACPCMLRISRAEEALFGSSRPAFQGRIKMGFRADGRVTAVDLYIVQQNGPYNGGGDLGGAVGCRLAASTSRSRCAIAACKSARTPRRRARSAAPARTRSRRRSSR